MPEQNQDRPRNERNAPAERDDQQVAALQRARMRERRERIAAQRRRTPQPKLTEEEKRARQERMEARREMLAEISDAHARWSMRHAASHAEFSPEGQGSDYSLHHLDMNASPEVSREFHEEANRIVKNHRYTAMTEARLRALRSETSD